MVAFNPISSWGHVFLTELEFGSVGFCGGRKTGEPGEKTTPWSKDENQQQTQPTKWSISTFPG